MNSSGESGPRSGCGQRTSASTAAQPAAVASSTCGWKTSSSSPAAIARLSSDDERQPLHAVLVEVARSRRRPRGAPAFACPSATSAWRSSASKVGAVLGMAGDPGVRADVERDAADHHRRARARRAPARPRRRSRRRRRRGRGRARTRRRRGARRRRAGRPTAASRRATSISTRSPRRCPSVSLISLKRVEPDHQHADLRALAPRAVQRALEHARDVLAVGEPGDAVVARLVLVDHRLAAAELDRHERDPDQRQQPQAVVGGDEDPGHERHEHDRPPGVQQQVAAHHQPRADPARERRRRARERRVDRQEDGRGGDERGHVLQLEVLQAVLVGQVAGERDQQPAGDGPADRVLGDVEHEPLERAAAHRPRRSPARARARARRPRRRR